LHDLDQSLWEYYGQLNERRAGVKIKPEDIVPKPAALVRYEQARDLGIPYVNGGLVDQPYIWMQEHGVIRAFLLAWDAVQAATNKPQT